MSATALAIAALAACGTVGATRGEREGASSGSKASCGEQFRAALPAVEGVEPIRRAAPALAGLASGCREVLGKLAEAAAVARELDRDDRAAALAAAATEVLPPACVAPTPTAPAATVTWSCPPPDGMVLADQLLRDLDAGTYLYAIAVRARLDGASAFDEGARRLIDNLMLGAALEGEQARQAAPVSAPQ